MEAASSRKLQSKKTKLRRRSLGSEKVPSAQTESTESGDESYSGILHKLINKKKLNLEAKDSFPPVKPNSFLCVECSKNMLSYVAVLQDILSVVIGDITEKVSPSGELGKSSELQKCPHCSKIYDNHTDQPKNNHDTSQISCNSKDQPPTGVMYEKLYSDHDEGKAVMYKRPSLISSHFQQGVPIESAAGMQNSNTHIFYNEPKGTSHSVMVDCHSILSGNLNTTDHTGDNFETPETVAGVQKELENGIPEIIKNAEEAQKRFKEALIEPTRTVSDVQIQLENMNPFTERVLSENIWNNSSETPSGQQHFFEDASIGYSSVVSPHYAGQGVRNGSSDRLLPQTGESVHPAYVNTVGNDLGDRQNNVNSESEEAYVTLATNNISAILSLVLGFSLLATKTSRSLVVLVTEGVCRELRYCLSTVYNVVQSVESLGTKEITKLSLLEDPELGISFVKLHVWQLTSFKKCVFLDSSTLVVQNCDELFKREELSAVPDIGWPDCFNSGVFVYVPSIEMFWNLTDFLESQESVDGGDQWLLNMYFNNWATDISRKLPFIYNMMANVSYTYKPALKQFASDVKIVHFFGSYNPWNVPFHSVSGDLLPTADVHPYYVQFVKYWLDVFVGCVLPQFDDEVINYCHAQKYSTLLELLQFFPSTPILETLPVQPSFRLYPDTVLEDRNDSLPLGVPEHEEVASVVDQEEKVEDPEITLPGSEVGDYRGMEAWEQGKADYLGLDKSDRIMARLDFLMQDSSKNS